MRNYSFTFKLFISFSVLLVTITIVYIIVYSNAVINSSKNEIGKNCIGKLKVAENTVMEFKNKIHKDIIGLSVNNAINALGEINNQNNDGKWAPDISSLLRLSDAQNVILQAVNTNNRYESIYLYLEDLGYSLTSNQGFVSNTDLRDVGWLKNYNDYKSKGEALGWIDTRLPYNNGEYADYLAPSCIITYIYPLTPYTTTLRGALVVNIKEDVLSKLINTNNVSREGYIFIINSQGNVISHIDKQYLCKNISHIDYVNDIVSSKKSEGYIITKINNQNYLVSFYKPQNYKSQNNDWIYVGVFSLETLISNANTIRINTIYLSIAISILSIIIFSLILNKLCSPVKKLIQDIKMNKGINVLEDGDEIMILRKAFESLSHQLEKNKRHIIQNHLNGLLKGKPIHQMVEADIEELNFSHQHFGCVVATIDKYDEFSKKYEVEHQYYLKMLILNIAEQVINSRYKCIGVNMDNGEIAFLVNVDANQTDELHHGLEECFGKIQHEIAKVFDYTISVGMGNCYQDWGNIHLSYAEAMQALKMKLIKGHGSINVWNNNEYRHGYYYPTILEKYMLNQIETRNISAIVKTVKQLINEIKNKDGLSSDNVIQIFNQLVGNTVVKYLIDNDIDMSHIFGSNFNIYNELSKKETLDEIEQLLMYVYETMIKYLNRISSEDDENVYRIMDYLQKNYNQDIGIQDVADHVGLSYSYVRKIFKEKTGKSIVDFLNDMRINEAKDLLLHNDISIKELAISLGYNSDHTFSRIFKKLEGVTPGEYRNKFKSVLIEERAEA